MTLMETVHDFKQHHIGILDNNSYVTGSSHLVMKITLKDYSSSHA